MLRQKVGLKMGNRFLKGAMILSIGMFATRLLGLLYVIPFQHMVAETGMALYGFAYNIYGVFISLATMGIPVGTAKFIARYNSKGDYATSRRIFRFGVMFMIILGLLGFAILYLIAPWWAGRIVSGVDNPYHSAEAITTAIRSVSFALIIIPPMAIFRGFFQGNQDMVPSSVSQFVEQLVRVVFIIAGTFIIINVMGMPTERAVYFSVFSALLAGLASFMVLWYYWIKNRRKFNTLWKNSEPSADTPDMAHLFWELISYAIPFAVLGLAANIFFLIDNNTWLLGMERWGAEDYVGMATMGIFGASLNKLIMIPVSFAIGFGQPLVPELTTHLTTGNRKEMRRVLIQAIQLTCFITIPAAIGISLLAHPIYVLLFGRGYEAMNYLGGEIFRTGSTIGLFMALYSILTAVLQGIGAQYFGIILMGISIIIKYAGNVVLMPLLGANGAIIATNLAFGFCIVGCLILIRKRAGLRFRTLIRKLMPIFVFSLLMGVIVWGGRELLNMVFPFNETSRFQGVVYIGVLGILGIAVYFGLAWYFGVIKSLFGFQPTLKRLLRRK